MIAAVGLLAGCATGVQPRPQHFTGNPYEVTAQHGVIAGDVCGLDIHYAVSRRADASVLLGPGTRRLEVRDARGGREVTGVLTSNLIANAVVDVRLSPDRIVGRVGPRQFDLVADGDVYRGSYSFPGVDNHVGAMEVAGRAEMLALPRPVLAAVTPALLTCDHRGWGRSTALLVQQPIAVRFGGPAHYETTTAR
jgi:hypothetical protein